MQNTNGANSLTPYCHELLLMLVQFTTYVKTYVQFNLSSDHVIHIKSKHSFYIFLLFFYFLDREEKINKILWERPIKKHGCPKLARNSCPVKNLVKGKFAASMTTKTMGRKGIKQHHTSSFDKHLAMKLINLTVNSINFR